MKEQDYNTLTKPFYASFSPMVKQVLNLSQALRPYFLFTLPHSPAIHAGHNLGLHLSTLFGLLPWSHLETSPVHLTVRLLKPLPQVTEHCVELNRTKSKSFYFTLTELQFRWKIDKNSNHVNFYLLSVSF